MVQKETYLKVSDNSGGKMVRCIGLYKGKTNANIGDIILVSVKTYNASSSLKKGQKYKALIIRTKSIFRRSQSGVSIKFNDNAVVLMDNSLKLMGNRIFGSTVREIKNKFPEVTNLITKVY